jgi:hypothetical protein
MSGCENFMAFEIVANFPVNIAIIAFAQSLSDEILKKPTENYIFYEDTPKVILKDLFKEYFSKSNSATPFLTIMRDKCRIINDDYHSSTSVLNSIPSPHTTVPMSANFKCEVLCKVNVVNESVEKICLFLYTLCWLGYNFEDNEKMAEGLVGILDFDKEPIKDLLERFYFKKTEQIMKERIENYRNCDNFYTIFSKYIKDFKLKHCTSST